MRLRRGCFVTQVPIYLNHYLAFCIGMTPAQAQKALSDHFGSDEIRTIAEADNEDDVGGRCVMLENGDMMVRTISPPNDPAGWAYLSHEIFHAADLTLRRLGMQLSDDSAEAWAYLIGWMTKAILESPLAQSSRSKPRSQPT